jgi:hypothetical protein
MIKSLILHLHLHLHLGAPLLPRKILVFVIRVKVDPLVAELLFLLAPRGAPHPDVRLYLLFKLNSINLNGMITLCDIPLLSAAAAATAAAATAAAATAAATTAAAAAAAAATITAAFDFPKDIALCDCILYTAEDLYCIKTAVI